MSYIILDLDMTISDCRWRDGWAQGKHGSWEEFHKRCDYDLPMLSNIGTIRRIQETLGAERTVISTARPESVRKKTVSWLLKHGIDHVQLHMRKDNDNRSSPDIKADHYDLIQPIFGKPAAFFDDRSDVIRRMQEIIGSPCLFVQFFGVGINDR